MFYRIGHRSVEKKKLVKLFFPKMIQKMVSASKGSTLVGNGAATYGLQTLQMAR